ncbi:MAG TPA: hypothetical protein DDX19_11345 [Rhodopirellula baltica]|uniref:DUF1592 domain-containing protein n=1 Tax=Rhodopirellula baltica TaxID=265606 RepID=UPI0003131FFF|nr:DUF1592 domain-containing protein [Rhodopirellula baltica]HBE63312.1 hypothetical protein [Rhodopirellula baltica]
MLRPAIVVAAALIFGFVDPVLGDDSPDQSERIEAVDCSTLTGKVMCGYQGWFNCEGDGAGLGWRHWGRDSKKPLGPGNVTVDLWPDMSEYSPGERFATEFQHSDGSVAEVFSSANEQTVRRHFQWMREYGIDGAFVQRFATSLRSPASLANRTAILNHCRRGSEENGRAFAVMYDLSGLREGELDVVQQDWTRLVNEEAITSSDAYLHHNGMPLVAIWGVGFAERHQPGAYTLDDCKALIAQLKRAGCSIMLGIPTGWRELNRDCVTDPAVRSIFEMADVISPWTPGRYRNPEQAQRHGEQTWQPDQQECGANGQGYLPVVFPGFSWFNLRNGDAPLDDIPRLKGQFLWSQIIAAKKAGAEMLYVAMFDEVDEATAIFKCTNNPPRGRDAKFVTYEGLPSDHYLKIVGRAAQLLRGEVASTETLPSEWLTTQVSTSGTAEAENDPVQPPPPPANQVISDDLPAIRKFVSGQCLDCHTGSDAEAGLDLQAFDFNADQFAQPDFATAEWEKILRRVNTRQMPPPDYGQPDEATYSRVTAALVSVLDHHAQQFPRPGRVGAMRRMTRVEYQYAIRDLLAVTIDASDYLPKDESSHGFDNITVEELSPTHLNRYVSAAQKIARVAIGGLGNGPAGVTIRLPADRSQEKHVEGLPFGTRGGVLFDQHFPQTGEYEIELKLTRDRDEQVEGLHREHEIDVLVDRARVHQFKVFPPKKTGKYGGPDYTHSDSHLKQRLHFDAGRHSIGVTFPKTFSSLTEGKRQPFDANFNRHRHPRLTPAIYQVSIVGPFVPEGPGNTTSRQAIFGEHWSGENANRDDAQTILERLARRAYRRSVTDDELDLLMNFFDEGFSSGNFDEGIESALTALLVNPNFLFRIESVDPNAVASPETNVVAVNDHELASRLASFLWSSLPDDELLDLADAKQLRNDDVLAGQVARMLVDPRANSLVTNFASQWLQLRNLDSITPDLRLFPDFDDNLRQSFQRETQLLFQDVLTNDRSVTDLIASQDTFLNERLATHYGIRGVTGSHFRRVKVSPESHRGGILRHGSILMVTSYATRTSPTIRGNWVMENIFGTPAPPPPPNVPNLKEKDTLAAMTVRERLAMHRANPTCASCHDLIDPLGFALENFDAVGRWRQFEGTLDVDSSGQLPDGTELQSVDELEAGIVARPDIFAQTVAEKLMTYALGRAVEPHDGPAIRRIVRGASQSNYTLASLINGIVLSEPFRYRETSSESNNTQSSR